MIIGIILLVLFGGKRLPELGKGLGEGLKGFKEGLKNVTEPTAPAVPAQPAATDAAMEYVTCSRCGGKFENPQGFKVVDFVCRSCQARG